MSKLKNFSDIRLQKDIMMDIKHQESNTKGLFYYEIDGSKLAELSYSKAGTDRIIIDHTNVSDSFRGKGLGKALVYFSVEFARSHNLKIIPLCPYAQSVFRRYVELQDVT